LFSEVQSHPAEGLTLWFIDCHGVAQSEGELPALQYEIYGVAFSAGHVRAERTSVDDVDLLSRQISDRDHFPSFVFMCLLLFINLPFCE
jgi:hypothetical protein